MDDAEAIRIIEALLFVSSEPLPAQRIAEVLGCERKEAQRLARALGQRYDAENRAVAVEEVAGGYQFRTRSDLAPWVRKLLAARPAKLSRAALETLAIVAYRQPVTRPDIEKIRGVDCSGVLQSLMDRKLVKIMGRMDVPGRPIIYGTARQFLELFGLSDLSQLPTLKEFEAPPGGHAHPEGASAGGEGASNEGETAGAPGTGAAGAAPADEAEDEADGLDADGG
jgi:segregation and condensation protein B